MAKNRRKEPLYLEAATEQQLRDGTNVIASYAMAPVSETPVHIRFTNPREPDRLVIAELDRRDAEKMARDILSFLQGPKLAPGTPDPRD